jgi:hypothetical protein
MRIMALEASFVGKITENVPADAVLSEPKSNTTTDLLLCVELYNSAPRAVKDAVDQEESAKSAKAVVPEDDVVPDVSVLPPATYAEPDVLVVSPDVVYAVVAAVRVAASVYSANLNVSAVVAPRTTVVAIAWIPLKSSVLNDVVMKFPVNAITASL